MIIQITKIYSSDKCPDQQQNPKRPSELPRATELSDLQAIHELLKMTDAIMTSEIVEQFKNKIDVSVSYSITDLKKILGEVYKEVKEQNKPAKKAKACNDEKPKKQRAKHERDENGDIIKKRAPSAYNLFIKDQSGKIKADNPDLDPKAVFKMAIDEWKKHKANADDADDEA